MTGSDLEIHPPVRTGDGDSTSIGAAAPHIEEWIARGH